MARGLASKHHYVVWRAGSNVASQTQWSDQGAVGDFPVGSHVRDLPDNKVTGLHGDVEPLLAKARQIRTKTYRFG